MAVDCFIKIPSGLRPNLVFQLPSDLRSYEPNLYAFGSAPGPRNSGVSLTSDGIPAEVGIFLKQHIMLKKKSVIQAYHTNVLPKN